MTQKDRVLGNIGAIITMLETFPMGFFNGKGKEYNSVFEFIMEILRLCGINDQEIMSYVIGKIYGFEGQQGFTINGLYEEIARNDFVIQPNAFIDALENSIKTILMALFTSIYTCSALPVLPNFVFDYDYLEGLMAEDGIQQLTMRTGETDYHLRIPIPSIDLLGMMSISPTTSSGRLYYIVDGYDKYYHREIVTETYVDEEQKYILAGEHYMGKTDKFNHEYTINLKKASTTSDHVLIYYQFSTNSSPIDIVINTIYIEPESDSVKTQTLTIKKGQSQILIVVS